jgi:hypothetical protein
MLFQACNYASHIFSIFCHAADSKTKTLLAPRRVIIRCFDMKTFCKPCFVPQYCKRPSSRTSAVIIYLQKHALLSFSSFISKKESAPTIIWVSRSWGLPRSTLSISGKAPSLWHFYRYSCHIPENLGIFPAVSSRLLPWLIFSPGTNTTGISACASMDFPLQH